MNIILFDTHETWADMLPLTFTRPFAELRAGILTFRDRWALLSKIPVSSHSRDYLAAKYPASRSNDELWIEAGIIPDEPLVEAILNLPKGSALLSGNNLIAARVSGGADVPVAESWNGPIIHHNHPIVKVVYPWDLVTMNRDLITRDFGLLTSNRVSQPVGFGNRIIGEENLFIEDGAKVQCAIINAEEGPVYIGKSAEIQEGAAIRGPLALCENSVVRMGAKIYGATTIGPWCKVGGEVMSSIFIGFSNKAHDGFLGDAVIGEWCNIGADTNNSNLKNTYEEVRMWNYRKASFISTGLHFFGLIMGDHSKTGINTMLNTGTVIGVSANVFGSGFPRNFIPSFSWGGAHGITEYKLEKALGVADAVMKRRGRVLDALENDVLTQIYTLTREHRLF